MGEREWMEKGEIGGSDGIVHEEKREIYIFRGEEVF